MGGSEWSEKKVSKQRDSLRKHVAMGNGSGISSFQAHRKKRKKHVVGREREVQERRHYELETY